MKGRDNQRLRLLPCELWAAAFLNFVKSEVSKQQLPEEKAAAHTMSDLPVSEKKEPNAAIKNLAVVQCDGFRCLAYRDGNDLARFSDRQGIAGSKECGIYLRGLDLAVSEEKLRRVRVLLPSLDKTLRSFLWRIRLVEMPRRRRPRSADGIERSIEVVAPLKAARTAQPRLRPYQIRTLPAQANRTDTS